MLSRKQISSELRLELSTHLKQLRQQRGISQEELAFAVEMTQPSISNYESGRCEIPLSVLISVCGFLDVSLEDLVPGHGIDRAEHYNRLADIHGQPAGEAKLDPGAVQSAEVA